MKTLLLVLASLLAGACTSVNVKPVPGELAVGHVVIERNPAAVVPDLVEVIREGFERHGISSEVVDQGQGGNARFIVTYSGSLRHDVSEYMDHAEVRLWHRGKEQGFAIYHLRGGGGLDLGKYADIRIKLAPVMNQMLKAYAYR